MGSERVDWALLYARAGWRSFPVTAQKKTPIYKNWQKDATTDPKMVRQYFPPGTERNIGLVCGEAFDAWDIEGQHLAAFSEYLRRHGVDEITNAPVASTARGGVHVLTTPTGVDGTRYLYLDGNHIGELKSRGGFVVACPSVFVDDKTTGDYVWVNMPRRLATPEAEPWLLALLERPVRLRKTLPTPIASPDDAVAVLGRLAASVAHAGEGRRNNYLYWAVRRAIEDGIPADETIKALRASAVEAGLDEDETEKTIESAIGAESVAA